MALDLTIAGGPIFASRSRVNSESRDYGVFVASTMQSLMARIIDGDPESYWHSATGDDNTAETLDISFQQREAPISRSIDLVVMQNINLKNFVLEYSNTGGAPFTTVPGFDYNTGFADNALPDLIKTFTPITANILRLRMFKTFIADDLKRVGGLIAALGTLQLVTGGMAKYDKKFRENMRSVKLGDNGRSDELIKRSATSYEHFGASVEITLATRTERDAIRAIKRDGRPFIFIPEPFDVPRDVFSCLFKGAWADSYQSSYKGAGYQIGFNIEEVGTL